MDEETKDLWAMLICTIIAIIATPVIYQIVFAEPFWWIK